MKLVPKCIHKSFQACYQLTAYADNNGVQSFLHIHTLIKYSEPQIILIANSAHNFQSSEGTLQFDYLSATLWGKMFFSAAI